MKSPRRTLWPGKYRVVTNESVPSVALRSGHVWETIWDHPDNRALAELRIDPNVLKPGDELVIPPLRERAESLQTGRRHHFRRKGVPSRLRLRLFERDRPRADLPFVLEVEHGEVIRGQTDGEGVVDVPYDATSYRALLWVGDDDTPYDLRVGWLRPGDGFEGAQQRLNNLGFACGVADGKPNARTRHAIRLFQAQYKLKPTGELDDPTRAALWESHDRTFVAVPRPEGAAK